MFDISNQIIYILIIVIIIIIYPKLIGYKRRIVYESKQNITFKQKY